MPRGSKEKYTDKQKRKAEHIEDSYEDKGVGAEESKRRAWATVNKQSGGGEKSGGSGRKKSESSKASARKSSAKRAATSRKKSTLKKTTKSKASTRGRKKAA